MKIRFSLKQLFKYVSLLCAVLSLVLFGNFRIQIFNSNYRSASPIAGSWYEFWVGDTEVFGYHVYPTYYDQTGRELVVFSKVLWHSIPDGKNVKLKDVY